MSPTGLAIPPAQSVRPPLSPNSNMALGGVMSAQSLASMQAQARTAMQAFDEAQAKPEIVGLSGHIKKFWLQAQEAKRAVEDEMLEALYARRGKYTAEKLAQIIASGQPAIYMMLASSKMRQAESLLRDTLIGSGSEKPWTLSPSPSPDLPPEEIAKIKEALTQEVEDAISNGLDPTLEDVRERMLAARGQLEERVKEAAQLHCDAMEDAMEDQLVEGGFNQAFDGFITDLTTFKAAFIAGPLVRNKPKLVWVPGNPVPQVSTAKVLEWERIDPFDMYPAPWAKSLYDAPMIRKHKLTREALTEMLGLGTDGGYSDEAIKKVLDEYGDGGLNQWLQIDNRLATAEGKTTVSVTTNTGLIDALQYWGSVSGKMLLDWGMDSKAIADPAKEYQVEAWLAGSYVIKAVLNADPLARRPYYGDSYECIPGSIWGNSPYDLMSDCQDMCNAAARSLAANLGISSGPQVVMNISRLAQGETVTAMYPWKIWQVEADPMGSVAPPITFFQPQSNAAELMQVFEKFSALADEYTGIPKYMTGSEGTPGAGRTASGLSMMIGNASKIIKQVVSGVDQRILTPLLERQYYWNMRWSDDPQLKGDVTVVARGAMSLVTKESAQVRRNEFLMATNNPTDMQILGLEGRAEVLRASASTLDLNPDKIVPPVAVMKEKQKAVQAAQAQQAAEAMSAGTPGSPGQSGSPAPAMPSPNGQALMNGAPQTDNFSPQPGAQ